MKILVLNAGSSSQKSCLYEINENSALPDFAPAPLWQADADWTHQRGTTEVKVTTARGVKLEDKLDTDARSKVIEYILELSGVVQHGYFLKPLRSILLGTV